MIGLFIICAIMASGIFFGLLVAVGSMVFSGKWTLPNTGQRTIQEARVRKEVATLRAETAQQDYFREQVETNRDVLRVEGTARLEAARDASFRNALESGGTSSP